MTHPSLYCGVTVQEKTPGYSRSGPTLTKPATGHIMSSVGAQKKLKNTIKEWGLKEGVHVTTDTGIKGTIKKITTRGELVLENCLYKINPLSVVEIN